MTHHGWNTQSFRAVSRMCPAGSRNDPIIRMCRLKRPQRDVIQKTRNRSLQSPRATPRFASQRVRATFPPPRPSLGSHLEAVRPKLDKTLPPLASAAAALGSSSTIAMGAAAESE